MTLTGQKGTIYILKLYPKRRFMDEIRAKGELVGPCAGYYRSRHKADNQLTICNKPMD